MTQITSNLFLRKAFLLSAIFFLATLYSCKKEGELSPDFDKGNANLVFTDTVSLVTSLERVDSIRTDVASENLVGLYNDPVFGPTSSAFYSQVSLNGINVDLKTDTANVDSVVLTMKYSGIFYGDDLDDPMTVDIYRLTEDMSTGTEYYSNKDIAKEATPFHSLTFTPDVTTTLSVIEANDTASVDAHLRIKLPKAIAYDLLNADMISNSGFVSDFKGFYITTRDSVNPTTMPSGDGAILNFDMNSDISALSMYYRDTTATPDTLVYDFLINSSSAKFNRFKHNHSAAANPDVQKHLDNDVTKDITVSYIQSMAGVKTKLEIPHIQGLKADGSIAIVKAELVVTLEDNSGDNFPVLEKIAVVGINADGNSVFLPDASEGSDYYGGKYDDATKSYTFNIARHIQQILTSSEPDYGMYLVASGTAIFANRTIFASENHGNPASKIVLKITYSKL